MTQHSAVSVTSDKQATLRSQCKEEVKDQDSIHSSSTPDRRHHMGK